MTDILLAFAGSACAGMLYNVRGIKIFWLGISGAVGWIVYILFYRYTGQALLSIFSGAIAVGIYSESAARILKSPTTVFSIPGIFPIVPGIAAYEAIQAMVQQDLQSGAGRILDTFAGACAIAFGIMLVTAMFSILTSMFKR